MFIALFLFWPISFIIYYTHLIYLLLFILPISFYYTLLIYLLLFIKVISIYYFKNDLISIIFVHKFIFWTGGNRFYLLKVKSFDYIYVYLVHTDDSRSYRNRYHTPCRESLSMWFSKANTLNPREVFTRSLRFQQHKANLYKFLMWNRRCDWNCHGDLNDHSIHSSNKILQEEFSQTSFSL